MDPLKVTAKLKRYKDVQQISDSFKKREFVVETEENYPQLINFELVQDKVNLIDNFKEGDLLEVFFNIRGREWQKDATSEVRVFNSLTAWRIQKIDTQAAPIENNASAAQSSATKEEEDDLPF